MPWWRWWSAAQKKIDFPIRFSYFSALTFHFGASENIHFSFLLRQATKLDCFELWCKMLANWKSYRRYRRFFGSLSLEPELPEWRCMSENYYWQNGKSFFMLMGELPTVSLRGREFIGIVVLVSWESDGKLKERSNRGGLKDGKEVAGWLADGTGEFYNFLLNQRSTLAQFTVELRLAELVGIAHTTPPVQFSSLRSR